VRAELPGAAGAVAAHSSLWFGDDRKYLLLFTSPDDDAYNTKISEDLRGLAVRRGVLAMAGRVFCGLAVLLGRARRATDTVVKKVRM
jgi:hypothetical protein